MGTDATALVEVKVTDRWVPAIMPIWANPCYNPDDANPMLRETLTPIPVMERDYVLFSLLADVRNRSGRGWKTMMKAPVPDSDEFIEWEYDTDDGGHDPIIPIAPPRGVPKDATTPWQELGKSDHFHDLTYLTLDELEGANWDQRVYSQGVVSEEEYIAYRDHGTLPKMVARGAGGKNHLTVNEVEYNAGQRGEGMTSIDLRWASGTVRDHAPWFFRHMEVMTLLAPDHDHTRVRLMVAFDS
jgi:hypothetical protein